MDENLRNFGYFRKLKEKRKQKTPMDEQMDFGWMIDYTCCTILWMKNTPTHPELAGWLAIAFQQKS